MARLIPPYALGERIGHCIDIEAGTVGEVLDEAERRWGADFRDLLATADVTVGGVPMGRLQGRATRVVGATIVAFVNPGRTWLPEKPAAPAEHKS